MRWIGLVGTVVSLVVATPAGAGQWGRAYIRQLPDSAFAAIETSAAGAPVRRLPHHDLRGAVDVPHLCNALARLPQVRWRDPANAASARRHLRDHVARLGGSPCRPASQGVR